MNKNKNYMKQFLIAFSAFTTVMLFFAINAMIMNPFYAALISFLIMAIIIFGFFANSHFKENNYFKNWNSKINKVEYYREIPCDNYLPIIYYISRKYNILENKSHIIGAFILKFILEKKVTVLNETSNDLNLDISNLKHSSDDIEEQFITVLKKSAKDNILSMNGIKKWFSNNPLELSDFYSDLDNLSAKKLVHDKIIRVNKRGKFKPTKASDKLAINILGFKRFLLDFGDFKKKDSEEVYIWENYLVIAMLLGIADKIDTNLKKLNISFEFEDICNSITLAFIEASNTDINYY